MGTPRALASAFGAFGVCAGAGAALLRAAESETVRAHLPSAPALSSLLWCLPLNAALVALLVHARPEWGPTSWWGRPNGMALGYLSVLIVCVFDVLPALLATTLVIAQWEAPSPLLGAVTSMLLCVCAASIAFWSDALPIVPRAHLIPAASHRAIGRAAFYLLHAACRIALTDGWAALVQRCAAMPASCGADLSAEIQALALTSHSPSHLAVHVAICVVSVYVVLDAPVTSRPDGRLWGAHD